MGKYSDLLDAPQGPKPGRYDDILAPAQTGGNQLPFLTEGPRINEAAPTGFFGKVKSAVTGAGRTEFDLPNFDLPFEISGRQIKTAFGLMTTQDPAREMQLLKTNYPEIKFLRDKFNNVIVDARPYGGEISYLNRPGFDARDAADLGFGIAAMTPAGKAGGLAAGALKVAPTAVRLGGRLAAAGAAAMGTQAGIDIAGQAAGTEKTVSTSNISIPDVAMAGVGGVFGEGVGMLIERFAGQAAKSTQYTPDDVMAAAKAAMKQGLKENELSNDVIVSYLNAAKKATDPEKIAEIAASSRSGIKYTLGQELGDTKQLQLEDSMRHGGLGADAQDIMTAYRRDVQDPSILKALSERQSAFQGGATPLETVTQAGGVVRNAVQDAAEAASKEVTGAYGDVGQASLDADGLKSIIDKVRRIPRTELFSMQNRATADVVRKLDDFSNLLDPKNGLKLRPYDIRRIEQYRQYFNKAIGAAENATDRAQVVQLKTAWDDLLNAAIEKNLFAGDTNSLQALKEARALHRAYMQTYEAQTITTKTGKIADPVSGIMQRLVHLDPTDEQVVNYIFGTNKLGARDTSAELVKRLKGALGEKSEAWATVREAAYKWFTKPARGETIPSGKQILNRISDAEMNNPTMLRELFTADEVRQIKELGAAIKQAQPEMINKSGTAYKQMQHIQQIWEGLATTIGTAKGGPVGGIAARQATKRLSTSAAERQAQRAAQGLDRPLKYISVAPVTAPLMVQTPYDTTAEYGPNARK